MRPRLTELLEPDLADAMMESMPPMPWDELATKADIAALDPRFETIDRRFEAIDQQFDLQTAHFDAKLDALEGRLALRWMETTRIIVLAMMILFGGVAGLAIQLGG